MSSKHFAIATFSSLFVAACGAPAPGEGGNVKITASGEALALTGYAFPPAPGQEVAFVDGWEVRFEHVITTIGGVTLSEGPDTSPGDKTQHGPAVATLAGPWAVDLHELAPGMPGVIPGKGGGDELAIELGVLESKDDGGAFDPTERYAFGYELLPAEADAARLGMSDEASALYDEMIAEGKTTLFAGTATFKGTNCEQSDAAGPVPYDFGGLPPTVHFRIAFDYNEILASVNCENPDNDPAEALPGEESLRGVQVRDNTETIAQVTLHTDHVFWMGLEHDSPPYFDHFAAWTNASGELDLESLHGVDLAELVDQAGTPIPWRSCLADLPVMTAPTYRTFDMGGVAADDLEHFVTLASRTMGHLNADGLCYVAGAPLHAH
jgi:hypothetical protein